MTHAQKRQIRIEADAQSEFVERSLEPVAFNYFRKTRLGEYQSMCDDLIRRHGLDDDSVDKSIALEWKKLPGPAEQRSWIQYGVGKKRQDEYRSMRDELVRRAGLRENSIESSIAIGWGKMGPAEKRSWVPKSAKSESAERGGTNAHIHSNLSQDRRDLSRSVFLVP